jgi:type IV secretory pathway ATPase VirB11/archaellum biosynthesis ATPase
MPQNLRNKIIKYRLHWRHPELQKVLRRIDKGRLQPYQVKRWMKKIQPWIEEQERCFNPFGPAPQTQDELGRIDIEVGHLIENPQVRVGIKILDDKGKSVIAAGATSSGKSNFIRKIIYGIDALNRAYDRTHNDPGTQSQR